MEVSGQLHEPAALLPASIERESGWTPELVWALRCKEKFRLFDKTNHDSKAVQDVA
jgi:hypothetical protein